MQLLGRLLIRAVSTQPVCFRSLAAKHSSRYREAQAFPAQLLVPWIQPPCLRKFEYPIRAYTSRPPVGNHPRLPPGIESPIPKQEASTETSSPLPKPEAEKPKKYTDKAKESDSSFDLPSSKDGRRSQLQQKFSQLMDALQNGTLKASHKLNEITGYTSIEGIKAENSQLEVDLAEAHERLRHARQAYKTSNAERAATQREVTTLLARKESWTPSDLERFTELYRNEHVLEGQVASAQEALTDAEANEQRLSQKLTSGILKRYHEEQIWSDRIRRASTWGTWGLMGMNFLLFVVLQFIAEPWRRRRLVRGVVAEEKEVLGSVKEELVALRAIVESRAETKAEVQRPAEEPFEPVEPVPSIITTPVPPPAQALQRTWVEWREIILDPSQWSEVASEWREVADDLYSDRKIDLRMREVTTMALQGVAAGAAVAGGIVWIMMRDS